MSAVLCKNYQSHLNTISGDDFSSSKDRTMRFWEQSDSAYLQQWTFCDLVVSAGLCKNYWPHMHEIFMKICHHPRTQRWDFGKPFAKQHIVIWLSAGLCKSLLDLHEILRDELSLSKDQTMRFWEWSESVYIPQSTFCDMTVSRIPQKGPIRCLWNWH